MTPTRPALSPDRLIWLPLFAALVVALVADQARANLHREARATVAAAFDDSVTTAAWCRLHLDARPADRALRIDSVSGLGSSTAVGGAAPAPSRQLDGRLDRSADAQR